MSKLLLRAAASAPALALAAALCLPAYAQSGPLADDVVQTDTVIVTGRINPEDPPVVAEARQRLSETPGAVAVVSSESYAQRYAPGLAEMLRDVPGVYIQKKWGGDTRLAIRGSGIGNSTHLRGTLVAQDGIPLNEADGFGDTQLVDPSIARFTEVYKGGNALRFGGALLGGAINIVTPTGRTMATPNLLRIEGGDHGSVRAHAETGRVFGAWDVFSAVTGATADGWRQQSEGQQQFASANVGYAFGDDREVRAFISGGYIHQEIPGSLSLADALNRPEIANPANVTLNYQRDQSVVRSVVQTRWRIDAETVFEGGVYATWKDLDHPIFQVIDQESRNFGAFGRIDWNGQVFGREADLFYGISVREGDLDANQWVNRAGSRGARTAASRQNAEGLDIFAEGRVFVTEQVAVVAGGSYGRADRDYQSFSPPGAFNLTAGKTYDWLAPRIGLLWQDDTGAQVYANVTRSVEPPNFSALSPTAAGFTALQPQEAWTGEVGARGQAGAFTWDVAAYRAELENELLTYTVNPAQGVPAATFNAGETLHQGIEAGLDWEIVDGLRLRQTYMWSDFTFAGDVQYGDNRLPVVPEHIYRAELRYQHAAGWFVAPSLEWSIKDAWVDYANTLKTPSYAVANLSGGWAFDNGVTLFVDVRNVFDERYVSNVSAITNARTMATTVFFPGDARSVYAGLSFGF
jgi:iron complex outermembrane receptor protein